MFIALCLALVTSRLDHCCSILVGYLWLPTSTGFFVGLLVYWAFLTKKLHSVYHNRIAVLVFLCLLVSTPTDLHELYLHELCHSVSDTSGRLSLCSSIIGQPVVPCAATSATSHILDCWSLQLNLLLLEMRLLPRNNANLFETILFLWLS